MPFGVVEVPSEDAQDAGLAEELWGTSEGVVRGVVGVYGYGMGRIYG
jgi:hypothetical protein